MEDMLAQIAQSLGVQINEEAPMDGGGDAQLEPSDMQDASNMGMDPMMAEGFNEEALAPQTMKTASGDEVLISDMLRKMSQYR
jgi:hypothetical protein